MKIRNSILLLFVFTLLVFNPILGYCQNIKGNPKLYADFMLKYYEAILDNNNDEAKAYLLEAGKYVDDANHKEYNEELVNFNKDELKRKTEDNNKKREEFIKSHPDEDQIKKPEKIKNKKAEKKTAPVPSESKDNSMDLSKM